MNSTGAGSGRRPLRLAAVGDLYIGRPLRHADHPDVVAATQLLRAADLRLANLECQLIEGDETPAWAAPGAWAGAPAGLANELVWLGVDAVSTANNHAGDYGSDGQASTEAALKARGIAWAGTGAHLAAARAPTFLDTPAGRVAMLAVSSSHLPHARAGRQREDTRGRPGVSPLRYGTRYRVDGAAWDALARVLREMPVEKLDGHRDRPLQRRYDAERGGRTLSFFGAQFVRGTDFGIESWAADDDLAEIATAIRSARHAADWVILQLHVHEYDRRPSEPPAFARELARHAIEAGADAVIGHGEHGVRGIEMHRGRPIFHGIGAFVFQPYLFPQQPADFYEAYRMRDAALVDVYRERREAAGFFGRLDHWEALLVALDLRKGAGPDFTVHPITLWPHGATEPDGLPHLAHNADGLALLTKVRELSERLGTKLALDESACTLRASPGSAAAHSLSPTTESRP